MAEDTGLVREVTTKERIQGWVQLVMFVVGLVVAGGVITQTEAIHYAKWPILVGCAILLGSQLVSMVLPSVRKAFVSHVAIPSQPQSANIVAAQQAADAARKDGRSPIPRVEDIRPPPAD